MILRLKREIGDDYILTGAENFLVTEFFCKCGKCETQLLAENLPIKLQALRDELGGAPITVTSGYRCPNHNKAVGGALKSKHMEGIAADIKVKDTKPMTVAWAADHVGFTGIKVYPSWVHVDLRGGPEWKPNLPPRQT